MRSCDLLLGRFVLRPPTPTEVPAPARLNAEDKASKIRGKNANERAEEHNAKEPEDIEDAMREEAQELHEEVTTRTEDEQAAEDKKRADALAKDAERVISSYDELVQDPIKPTSNFAGQLFFLTAAANLESGQAKSGVKGPLILGSNFDKLISITWS